ncbi:MAG: bifunctional riboflavin kinase/FAD synthetase [Acidimicrobiia bacterium]|nr:MAG: bifunctional riboflavin kinase/FAD synthetase [Acidimicrobiia bacterium]
MIVHRGHPETWDPPAGGSAVAIGVFDGVHRGHQHVLAALDAAPEYSKVVLTFGTHPAAALSPQGAPPKLTTLKERLALFAAAGVDRVGILDFDDEMIAMAPEAFVQRVLVNALDARLVVVGEGFRFGNKAEGTTDTLIELGRTYGFEVAVVPILSDGGNEIRSTAIREAIAAGDVERAAELLGRPYVIRGIVVPGEGRGRTIGVPTANISFPAGLAIPRYGVYAVRVEVDGARLPAVANFGVRPTFGGDDEVLEVHIIDADVDIDGREIGAQFVARLRDEQRFDGVDALVEQIQADIETARGLLDEVSQTS